MYILFLVSLVITTVSITAHSQTAADRELASSDQHHHHQYQQQQQQQDQHQHEQQSLFRNQTEQFGAQTKNDDETFRTTLFEQQLTETATSSIPTQDNKAATTTTTATTEQATSSSSKEATSADNSQPRRQSASKLSVTELKNFRLEYNKYKILSHLGITANPDELAPQLDEDLRTKLTATTAFNNNSTNEQNSGVRHKRSLSCDQVNGNKNTCCLENFYINFTHIGWDKWILYPAGYNANYCRGHCDLSHARYYHSTLLSKYSNIVSLCCSPKQMGSLRLLYIDENNKVHQKTIPDMVVESCDCA